MHGGRSETGSDWDDGEVDRIVAEYFAMLHGELAGRAFVKAHRAAALMAEIGRTHRSVEFKHMNISAVLSELGRPTIRGHKPKPNYQRSIITAVERFLTAHPDLAPDFAPRPLPAGMAEAGPVFEEAPPQRGEAIWARNPDMERLVRKFDPAERDARNRALGHAGEALVFHNEQQRLRSVDRADLARKVRWVAQEDGDGAGYDIKSFDESGREQLLEVKTTLGTRKTPFLLTRNEHGLSEERPDAFRLVRVFEFDRTPRLFRLEPPLQSAVNLSTELFRASFGPQ